MNVWRSFLLSLVALAQTPDAAAGQDEGPSAPWFVMAATHRTRFERLENPVVEGRRDVGALSLRTTLFAEARPARTNLHSAGLELAGNPTDSLEVVVGHRASWLARARDGWTTTGLRDPDGRSGRFLGQQLEVAASWQLHDSVHVDSGFVHMWLGEFAESAPGAANSGNPTYFYAQVGLSI